MLPIGRVITCKEVDVAAAEQHKRLIPYEVDGEFVSVISLPSLRVAVFRFRNTTPCSNTHSEANSTHTHTHTHTQITSTSILQEVLPGILQEVLQGVVLPEVSGAIFSFLFEKVQGGSMCLNQPEYCRSTLHTLLPL